MACQMQSEQAPSFPGNFLYFNMFQLREKLGWGGEVGEETQAEFIVAFNNPCS